MRTMNNRAETTDGQVPFVLCNCGTIGCFKSGGGGGGDGDVVVMAVVVVVVVVARGGEGERQRSKNVEY